MVKGEEEEERRRQMGREEKMEDEERECKDNLSPRATGAEGCQKTGR